MKLEDEGMELTHFNPEGRAQMVDVSGKEATFRVARAAATVRMAAATAEKIRAGQIGKGDVLAVAQVAGIMAAKKNSELIPMCHPLMLTKVDLRFSLEETALRIFSEVRCPGRDRRGDGSPDRGIRGGADSVRHVQGGAEGYGDHGYPFAV